LHAKDVARCVVFVGHQLNIQYAFFARSMIANEFSKRCLGCDSRSTTTIARKCMTHDVQRPATFFLSVDVSQRAEGCALIDGIDEALRRFQIRAMWSFEFAAPSRATERVTRCVCDYGVLAASAWANPAGDRMVFARELASRLNRAGEAGVKPIALSLVDTDGPNHFDLLVKSQLAIIRSRANTAGDLSDSLQPRLSRYGIWQAAPTMILPAASTWSLGWNTRRMLQRAIDGQQTVHVAINVEAMLKNYVTGLASLEQVLKLVSTRRDAGTVRVVSARELVELYSPRREQLVSRSVLRAA
jgi:hypothetical protein